MKKELSIHEHYDNLIAEDNDPFRDTEIMQNYMNRWTGKGFIDLLECGPKKRILEVGVGTGRLAKHVLEKGCLTYTGIDLSDSTLNRTQENLSEYQNMTLIQENILSYDEKDTFDTVFSVLTFIHIEDKRKALEHMISSLKKGGVLVLSLDNMQEPYLDMGAYQVKVFPNKVNEIIEIIRSFSCCIDYVKFLEEDHQVIATIIKAYKQKDCHSQRGEE